MNSFINFQLIDERSVILNWQCLLEFLMNWIIETYLFLIILKVYNICKTKQIPLFSLMVFWYFLVKFVDSWSFYLYFFIYYDLTAKYEIKNTHICFLYITILHLYRISEISISEFSIFIYFFFYQKASSLCIIFSWGFSLYDF
jgi:hypothetical protein